ncbi:hypothetical protein FPJ27_15175 [Burkholderia sp. MS455]|nr:hypothetical protein FPJ27_15175 [Burkholderia sp. MS455]
MRNKMRSLQQHLFEYASANNINIAEADLNKPIKEIDLDSLDLIGFIAECERVYNFNFPLPIPDFENSTPQLLIEYLEKQLRIGV